MVGSWYLTHATKNASWIFMLSFLFLSCRGKRKGHAWANMKTIGMQFVDQKSLLNAYARWCNDSCKMWCWNMIMDKCRNDMFNMMPWRDAYAMHDMNAFTDTRARKIISPYCAFGGAHLGAQCPMCAVKKTIWIFRLPTTKDETNIQRVRDDMM